MVGDDLHILATALASHRAQPARVVVVKTGAFGLRGRAVRHVTDEGVPEAVGRRSRRAQVFTRADEIAPHGLSGIARQERCVLLPGHGVEPEVAPEDARALEEPFHPWIDPVEPRRDDAMKRRWDGLRITVVDHDPSELFDVKRIPLRAKRYRREHIPLDRALPEKLACELLRLLPCEWLELDPNVRRRACPRRVTLEELRASQSEDQRRCADPRRELVKDLEQRRFGPVKVFEHERGDNGPADPFQVAGEGGRKLGMHFLWSQIGHTRLRDGERHEPAQERSAFSRCADGLHRALELFSSLLRRVRGSDARGLANDLAQRRQRDALAVRGAVASEEAGGTELLDELVGQPRLPNTSNTRDQDSTRTPGRSDIRIDLLQDAELGLSTDEGRATRADPTRRRLDDGLHGRGLDLTDTLSHDRSRRSVPEPTHGESTGQVPNEDLAMGGRLLKASSHDDR